MELHSAFPLFFFAVASVSAFGGNQTDNVLDANDVSFLQHSLEVQSAYNPTGGYMGNPTGGYTGNPTGGDMGIPTYGYTTPKPTPPPQGVVCPESNGAPFDKENCESTCSGGVCKWDADTKKCVKGGCKPCTCDKVYSPGDYWGREAAKAKKPAYSSCDPLEKKDECGNGNMVIRRNRFGHSESNGHDTSDMVCYGDYTFRQHTPSGTAKQFCEEEKQKETGGNTGFSTGGNMGCALNGQGPKIACQQTGGYTGNPTGGYMGNPTGGYTGNPTGGYTGNPPGGYTGNPTGVY